jgi:hypothetical protein
LFLPFAANFRQIVAFKAKSPSHLLNEFATHILKITSANTNRSNEIKPKTAFET